MRAKLRHALVKKLLGPEAARLDPAIHSAAASEVQQLLVLPRLTEQDLAAAERRMSSLKAQFAKRHAEPYVPQGGGGGWVGPSPPPLPYKQGVAGWHAPKPQARDRAHVAPARGGGQSNWERHSTKEGAGAKHRDDGADAARSHRRGG